MYVRCTVFGCSGCNAQKANMKFLQITCTMNVNPISFSFQQKLAGIQPKEFSQDFLPAIKQSGTEPNTTGEVLLSTKLYNPVM